MIEIQNATAVAALVEEFGLKGRFRLNLDEVIVPVAIVADIRPSDITGSIFRERFSSAAVAGENPVLEFAGANRAFCLPRLVHIETSTAGEVFAIRHQVAPAVQPVFTGPSANGGIDGWNPTRIGPCQIRGGTFPIAGLGGNLIATVTVPVGQTALRIDELLTGIRLGPTDLIYIIGQTANTGCTWSWQYEAELRED